MGYSEVLAEQLRDGLRNVDGISERKMFGGIAFMLNGNMCCGVINKDLVLRLGDERAAAALNERHTRKMDFTGKPLKSMVHGRPDIPVYTGSMAPKSQAMSAELADGCLLACMHPERPEVLMKNFEEGFAKAGNGKSLADFDIAPTVVVAIGDPEHVMLPCKMQLALYIGGMGSKQKNFYKDYLSLVGFEEACEKIQSLFFERKRKEAVAAVPDEMVDALYLVGPKDRIRDRFQRWKDSPVGTFMVGSQDMDTLRFMAELNS